jgi:hypothetical protein
MRDCAKRSFGWGSRGVAIRAMAARNNMESTLAAANPKDKRARRQKRDLFLIFVFALAFSSMSEDALIQQRRR